ncbi:MAG: hypothetical protein K6E96_00180, partial [Bacteroidales bacterium]|nr:hypothetical protein [Bacteroidales bacterium]
LTTALIAMLALFTVSCRSSKTVTQQTHNEAVHDTVIETVTLTLHDTIRETTTITIQTNETGDTTRLTTNRDREKIISRDRAADRSHHLTQTAIDSTTQESTTTPIIPIQPINPKSPIKPIAIAFIIGLLLSPLIKLIRRLKC